MKKKLNEKAIPLLSQRLGFTLAEVLITLGIIGVIAALTIPALIANYQKGQYVTGLKKAYTMFNQVLVQIAADKGCVGDLACTDLFAPGTDTESLGIELAKYFKAVKTCAPGTLGCFSNNVSWRYDGQGARSDLDNFNTYYRFITADGMSFQIFSFATYSGEENCVDNLSVLGDGPMSKACGYATIDVNGLKGPNNYGRDVFNFVITTGKGPQLYPSGGADDGDYGYWQDGSGNPLECYSEVPFGSACAGRIIEEGWQMNY